MVLVVVLSLVVVVIVVVVWVLSWETLSASFAPPWLPCKAII